jgi:MFS family permease
MQHDELLKSKADYLNTGLFLARTAGYFGVWMLLALVLDRLSASQDRRGDHGPSRTAGALGGPGLILLFLTGTFAAIDWMMTLEPHWVSSIYGAMVVVGQGLATLSTLVILITWMSDRSPMNRAVTHGRLHDLGNLMLAFTMLWAYMSFSQFLITWSGNLPEEIPWYLRRAQGPWQWVALILIVFHFFVPFFVLLFRENKRYGKVLAKAAAWILAMHWLDLVWLIVPASFELHEGQVGVPMGWATVLLSLAALVGVGGIWLSAFFWRLRSWPMIPLNDPNLNEVLEHAHDEG